MTQLSLRRELRTSPKSATSSAPAAGTGSSQLIATLTNPDLITIVVFCTIGLLVALNLIFRLSDLSAFL
jgi:hypothetical protein